MSYPIVSNHPFLLKRRAARTSKTSSLAPRGPILSRSYDVRPVPPGGGPALQKKPAGGG